MTYSYLDPVEIHCPRARSYLQKKNISKEISHIVKCDIIELRKLFKIKNTFEVIVSSLAGIDIFARWFHSLDI